MAAHKEIKSNDCHRLGSLGSRQNLGCRMLLKECHWDQSLRKEGGGGQKQNWVDGKDEL